MYRGAIQSMLSELVRQDRLVVTQDFTVDAPKTKQVADEAQEAQAREACSSSSKASTRSCSSAARNLPHVEVLPVALLNPLSLVSYDKVLVTVGAVKLIEERLQ